ncbi:hypothetical protein NVP1063O_230 [Vibrio phage 1.063.O._10N.261.45.C7]|nr:hypothetical protein NVP1063O_230 [Vibrio phage 1.063.O._10N.261.45.C7]
MNKIIINLLKWLGIYNSIPPKKEYKIEPKMITPNVVRMDMKSFRRFLATEEGKRKSGHYFNKEGE